MAWKFEKYIRVGPFLNVSGGTPVSRLFLTSEALLRSWTIALAYHDQLFLSHSSRFCKLLIQESTTDNRAPLENGVVSNWYQKYASETEFFSLNMGLRNLWKSWFLLNGSSFPFQALLAFLVVRRCPSWSVWLLVFFLCFNLSLCRVLNELSQTEQVKLSTFLVFSYDHWVSANRKGHRMLFSSLKWLHGLNKY